jgi:hypothetical protein
MAGTGKAHNTSIRDNNRSGAASTTLDSPMHGLAAADAVAKADSEPGVYVINRHRRGAEEFDRAA